MIHTLGEWNRTALRFHHANQNAQFKTYQLFISGIFHLIFLDHVTKTVESKISGNWKLLYTFASENTKRQVNVKLNAQKTSHIYT